MSSPHAASVPRSHAVSPTSNRRRSLHNPKAPSRVRTERFGGGGSTRPRSSSSLYGANEITSAIDYEFASIAIKVLREETGMDFDERDNPSIPPLMEEMSGYVAQKAAPLPRAKLVNKTRFFVKRRMLCGKHVDEETDDDDNEVDARPMTPKDNTTAPPRMPNEKSVYTTFVDREECIDESCFEGDVDDERLIQAEGNKWLVLSPSSLDRN
ncbi:MAG: hypothetical protein M1837_003916 [Sclerophora amabilis]|nr:MAG: hypothetical protein M1837_003916 [Sclerophora amabilis]